MSSINKYLAIGRVGRDPEGKVVVYGENKQIEKVEFSMAITDGYGAKATTMWLNLEAFGGLAKTISTYVHKGDMLGIVGKLKINKFENKQGQKVTMTKIIVEEIQFLPKSGASTTANPEAEYLPDSTDSSVELPKTPDDSFVDVPDGIEQDLPFR